jgi:hypothetical protein
MRSRIMLPQSGWRPPASICSYATPASCTDSAGATRRLRNSIYLALSFKPDDSELRALLGRLQNSAESHR